MAPLQVNKLASTEDSASAKSLTKKWPSKITSLLDIAVEKDKKLLLEGRNSREKASIIDLATQTMALLSAIKAWHYMKSCSFSCRFER